MMNVKDIPYKILGAAVLALACSGCIALSSSPTPRFYLLQAADTVHPVDNAGLAAGIVIGIGPVRVPAYLDRPQIVTRDKALMLKFAQFDRWGEPLGQGVARLIREDLALRLPGAGVTTYPWDPSVPVTYRVTVEIMRLEGELDGDLRMMVQWQVIDMRSNKLVIMKVSELHQSVSPQDYSGLAATLSTQCASLSAEIAAAVLILPAQPAVVPRYN